MKVFLFLLPLILHASTDIYSLKIQASNGKTINMSTFKGNKILIDVINPSNLNTQKIQFLDSLQKANSSLKVIIIPMRDFSANADTSLLTPISKSIPANLNMSTMVCAKKSKGSLQNSLLRWLTNASDNTHFDADVETDEQIYLINETGSLYAVLQKGVSVQVIDQLIKQ